MKNSDACILFDKPPGETSARLVARVKREGHWTKLGHAGTLDRFASGLMLLLAGKATRLCPLFVGLDKRYRTRVAFGVETSTLDPEGEVVAQGPIPTRSQVEQALAQLVVQREQLPPDFSALHVRGQRAYQLALQGKATGLKPRAVSLYDVQLLGWAEGKADLVLHCSSGYYVRAFARDLGRFCASCASVHTLRREAIGPFDVRDAVGQASQSPLTLLRQLSTPLVEIKAEWYAMLRNGTLPPLAAASDGSYLLHRGTLLVAIADCQRGRWRLRVNFYPGL